jgi:hypothetical protein
MAKVLENGVDRDLACQFPSLLSAHSIAHYENSVAQVVTKIVFVVLTNEPDVGVAGGLDYKAHRAM